MQASTHVETRVQGDVGIMDIKGEVTSLSEKVLQESYARLTEQGLSKIGLNFSDVAYINSAGMAVIITLLTQSREKGQKMRAWGLTQHFQKIFDMVGITKYVDHFPGEAEALQDF